MDEILDFLEEAFKQHSQDILLDDTDATPDYKRYRATQAGVLLEMSTAIRKAREEKPHE